MELKEEKTDSTGAAYVYAILRVDDEDLMDIAVKKVVPTRELAEKEVKRLNELNRGKCHYWCQETILELPPYQE